MITPDSSSWVGIAKYGNFIAGQNTNIRFNTQPTISDVGTYEMHYEIYYKNYKSYLTTGPTFTLTITSGCTISLSGCPTSETYHYTGVDNALTIAPIFSCVISDVVIS